MMYAPAVMGEDVKLCEEFLHFAANETNYLKPAMEIARGNFTERDRIINEEKNVNLQPSANADINVMLLFLGRDQEAYEFLKYSVANFDKVANYELFKNMPKKYDTNPNSRMEKFFAMDFFKRLLITTQKSTQSTCYCSDCPTKSNQTSLFLAPYWLTLAIIKINVIEEMKRKLDEMEAYFQRCDSRKKFKNSPKILEGLAIIHIGNDEESFLIELNDQKQQLKKLLNYMVKNFQGIQEISYIWLAIEGDCREYFINNYQKEKVYWYLTKQCLFTLIKYFNRHPTASQIILECMEKNKIGLKNEKNFYINLKELPKKPHYLMG